MGVAIHVARTENEAPAQLEGILAETMLLVAASPCPRSGHGVVTAKEMKDGARSQARRAIRLASLIDQEREGDAGLLAKDLCVVPVAQADGRKTRAFFSKRLLALAQLRDVLTAENSTVVSQEYENDGPVGPQ